MLDTYLLKKVKEKHSKAHSAEFNTFCFKYVYKNTLFISAIYLMIKCYFKF